MKLRFGDLLFWFFLILFVILVLWRVFGSSPAETTVFSAAFGVLFVGMFNIDRRVTRLEERTRNGFSMMKMETKNGFEMMKRDVNLIKGDLDLIKGGLGV